MVFLQKNLCVYRECHFVDITIFIKSIMNLN